MGTVRKRAQRESKWLKMAQNRVKMAQNRFKMAQSGVKMAQHRPKIGVSGQNKHCQNTAERKLQLNTPQGRSGCHTFAAFGAPGTKSRKSRKSMEY